MNFFTIPDTLMVVLAFLTAMIVSASSIPPIVALSKAKKLFDEPGSRSAHKVATPMLGGLAIFIGFTFSFMIFAGQEVYMARPFITAAMLVIFVLGMKDDIFVLSPMKKLMGQVGATLIVVVLAGVRITHLHGFLGYGAVPATIGIPLTFFVIIVVMNAYNLVDGIDGLAGSLGNIAALTFGAWFLLAHEYQYAIMAFALAGALIGFLRYNLMGGINKIFMGDTGSLLAGFILAILAVNFNECNKDPLALHYITAAPAVSIGILMLPLYDTARVMLVRMMKRHSPFKADKNHIHHQLLRLRYTHVQATLLLTTVSIGFTVLAFSLKNLGVLWLTLVLVLTATALYLLPITMWTRRARRTVRKKLGKGRE